MMTVRERLPDFFAQRVDDTGMEPLLACIADTPTESVAEARELVAGRLDVLAVWVRSVKGALVAGEKK